MADKVHTADSCARDLEAPPGPGVRRVPLAIGVVMTVRGIARGMAGQSDGPRLS